MSTLAYRTLLLLLLLLLLPTSLPTPVPAIPYNEENYTS